MNNNITYTVKYRLPITFRGWVTLKNVVGDGIERDLGFRFFTLQNNEMVYIPLYAEVKFSKERMLHIEATIKKEAGK